MPVAGVSWQELPNSVFGCAIGKDRRWGRHDGGSDLGRLFHNPHHSYFTICIGSDSFSAEWRDVGLGPPIRFAAAWSGRRS